MNATTELLAYCGLYCGDCAGCSGEIAEAAATLLREIECHRFERTAKSLFAEELPDYDAFQRALEFVSGLKCSATCRARKEPCGIARCCLDRGFRGCYECDGFEECDKLASLEDLHGDACVLNLRAIRRMGPEAWLVGAHRLWFGSDVDGAPAE